MSSEVGNNPEVYPGVSCTPPQLQLKPPNLPRPYIRHTHPSFVQLTCLDPLKAKKKVCVGGGGVGAKNRTRPGVQQCQAQGQVFCP